MTRQYRCNNCGWTGEKPASAHVNITGGKYAKDTVVMSVCPHCAFVTSTLKRIRCTGVLQDLPQSRGTTTSQLVAMHLEAENEP